ncbi:Transcriptional regulatory C terminal domain protein [Synechococcus sp. PCC 7335]|uniref:response regulator transcription factor NblR n=1 Tax=Synechococcus sp. (strain ATCC 29403 / PCC 7335) TaxID=91464 RepID=UPI00017ED631|nr:response regulator transcription factor [Synechococcus sp. PCC 7335]EDX86215.1 Transcriptional regulatory C terminal domain protein [Synechococcus sp. PCC 7335]
MSLPPALPNLPSDTSTPPSYPYTVLVLESDETLAHRISVDLHEAGYTPIEVYSIRAGLAQARTARPALIVVARRLKDESGLDLCRQLRNEQNRVPILLMMTHNELSDRVACLESGADDYFLSPYRSDDFINLVNTYLKPETTSSEQLRFADMVLDVSQRQVLRGNRIIELTMKEFELLKYLMEHPREVLTRKQILESVWGYDFIGESNVIEVYIRYLRLKMDEEGEKRLIQTVRGVGYVLRET